ncbi:MAG: ACT domain-containing protein [Gemmatimonadota bacterium]
MATVVLASIFAQMQIVDQISIFIENEPGSLGALCQVLAAEGVNIRAMMVPSGTDYGIVHTIVSDHETALQVLEQNSYRTYTSSVVELELDDAPGALAKLAEQLLHGDVDIKYAYAAVASGRGRLILAVSDAERASKLLGLEREVSHS